MPVGLGGLVGRTLGKTGRQVLIVMEPSLIGSVCHLRRGENEKEIGIDVFLTLIYCLFPSEGKGGSDINK